MFMQDISRSTAAFAVTSTNTAGLAAGTVIDTATGWRDVASLRIGDLVHTMDGGLRPVIALSRDWLLPGTSAHLLHLPGGVMNNCTALTLLPGQTLLIDLDPAEHLPDAIMALIPAESIAGISGATLRAVDAPVEIIRPVFADEEVIFAASGLRLHCAGAAPGDSFFTTLTLPVARAVLRRQFAAQHAWAA